MEAMDITPRCTDKEYCTAEIVFISWTTQECHVGHTSIHVLCFLVTTSFLGMELYCNLNTFSGLLYQALQPLCLIPGHNCSGQ